MGPKCEVWGTGDGRVGVTLGAASLGDVVVCVAVMLGGVGGTLGVAAALCGIGKRLGDATLGGVRETYNDADSTLKEVGVMLDGVPATLGGVSGVKGCTTLCWGGK